MIMMFKREDDLGDIMSSLHSFDDPEPIAAINQPVRQEERLQKK